MAHIALLDGFALDVADGSIDTADLPHGIQRLIAHVSLAGRPTRAATGGQLWPEQSECNAQSSLRSALWRLQKTTPGLLEVSRGSLRLAEGVQVDVNELVAWAREVLDPSSDVAEAPLPDVALRGELLPGWYDDWVLLAREHLRQLRMHALEVLADELAIAHRFGDAIQAALAAVNAEPLRESAHRAVIRVHLAEGNIAEAVREYVGFKRLLDRELGVSPSDQMHELMRGIRLPVGRRSAGR
jgi:DNA-binding SARP family transcriptional activator